MLPVQNIYLDSCFKSSDSASHSDFGVNLPENCVMPDGTGFYIDDVCVLHAWYPVEAGRNAQIFVTYDVVVHVVAIDLGRYSVQDPGVAIVDAVNKK